MWQHTNSQLSFLRQAVLAPPETVTFELAADKILPLEGLHGGKSPFGVPNQAWLCRQLYQVLSKMAESGHMAEVHEILEYPLRICPEVSREGLVAQALKCPSDNRIHKPNVQVLCVALASTAPTEWGVLHREVCQGLVTIFANLHPNSSIVLGRVWPENKDIIIQSMLAMYKEHESSIYRILDVCEELEGLTTVLDATPFNFATELAALAARREVLNIEKWLQDRISFHRLPFLLVDFQRP